MESPARTTSPATVPAARVRLWELIAFQAVFAGSLAVNVQSLNHHPSVALATDLIHGIVLALVVFAVGDFRLGDGARFSVAGRIALIVGGLYGVCTLWILYHHGHYEWWNDPYEGLERWFFGYLHGQQILVVAVLLAMYNILASPRGRLFWRWVPLVSLTCQLLLVWQIADFLF